ncbi:hypothetical protein ACPV3S_11515 [Photobacterium damselae]|uniref:hypothetical protein n=1 Tax=Photobacterium damselae TaxID=38293 RepID=UPI0010FE005A|nr:hypothetical protein [Photobacterium damselae]KAB1508258.1 hypothetical protein FD717_014890 [Photobacterium damselae subsp. damselae]MDC4167376.1 hypothetical protein [Photobacterium damselae]TLS65368.1 hypothetical protein FD718_20375 [Photobacterium damselae subsp. damselae]
MCNKRHSLLLLLAFISGSSQAIGINSMVEFAENNKGSFTITNPASYRQFIQVGITEIKVMDNGELELIPYNRENIDDWTLSVRPARTVIDPKLKKIFQVRYQPKSKADEQKDKAYRLTFIPTPYFKNGEQKSHAVQVAVGFAPLFIVPAKNDQPLNYEITYKNKEIFLKNHGHTYIRAFLDACPDTAKGKDREQCSKIVYALSGRDLPISLTPEMMQSSQIKVELSTHNSTYKRSFTLSSGQMKKD